MAPGELLLDYATGSIDPGYGLAMAAHLSLNAEARRQVAGWTAVGGVLLEDVEPADLAADALARTLARLEQARPGPVEAGRVAEVAGGAIPAPVRRLLPGPLASLPWRRVMSGLEEFRFDVRGAKGKVSLLRIEPGRAMPRHTHRGQELTLVLDGHYVDRLGRFERGDLALLDETVDHQPVAGEGQPCICLVVCDAPLKLTGAFGRLLNPFIRF